MSDSLDALLKSLSGELKEIVKVLQSDSKSDYIVEIPETFYQDSVKEDIESLIARTSNIYSRLSRMAGIAHTMWKALEVELEHAWAKAYKESDGKNDALRKADATIATEELARRSATYEGTFRILDRHARAAELASESARKIASKAENMMSGDRRQERGNLRERDFTSS